MIDPDNPLPSRVIVNRIWHHMMGRGIVATTDDLGAMGKAPTHPQLLDYLAERFIEKGWSIKQLVRAIALSSTYRMSSGTRQEYAEVDPRNELWHHMPVRRLRAEAIRDQMLAVSGRLDRSLFGPSVKVHLTLFMRAERSPKESGPLDGAGRRSIYTEVRRNHLPPLLLAFDRPNPFMTIGNRHESTSPAQSLILLNDPFVHEQAEVWARRLGKIEDTRARITRAYLEAYARPPTATELHKAFKFLNDQHRRYVALGEKEAVRLAWTDLCHTLMNVKEFIYY